eukprot:s1051_g2.t1
MGPRWSQNQGKLNSKLGRKSRVYPRFNAKANPCAHALDMSHIKPWLSGSWDLFGSPLAGPWSQADDRWDIGRKVLSLGS